MVQFGIIIDRIRHPDHGISLERGDAYGLAVHIQRYDLGCIRPFHGYGAVLKLVAVGAEQKKVEHVVLGCLVQHFLGDSCLVLLHGFRLFHPVEHGSEIQEGSEPHTQQKAQYHQENNQRNSPSLQPSFSSSPVRPHGMSLSHLSMSFPSVSADGCRSVSAAGTPWRTAALPSDHCSSHSPQSRQWSVPGNSPHHPPMP